jgi:exopolysaccharide biosynthesis polyprenyl glycosylphosphotransferase
MHRGRKNIHIVYLLTDALFIAASFYMPYCIRYNIPSIFSTRLPYFREYWIVFSFWGLALGFLLHNYRLFQTDRSLTIPKESWRVAQCVLLASLLAGLVIFGFQIRIFSRIIFFQSAFLLVLTLSIWRILKRLFVRYRITQGYNNINVLIVGAGKAGKALVGQIKRHPFLGLNVIGFLDDAKIKEVSGYPVLGVISAFEQIARQHFVDEVYITIPSAREKVVQILDAARRLRKTVRVLADNFTFLPTLDLKDQEGVELPDFAFFLNQVRLNHLGAIPLIDYLYTGPHGTEKIVKRIFDIVASFFGLIVLAPFFVVLVILIKWDSPGPIFYVSKRCGKKGQQFDCYKFRSMIYGAEKQKEDLRAQSEVKGPIFKMKNDPRVTRVGRSLRKYSLDELPQLFNVFKGDMSLVGPRPPTPDEVEKYDSWQMRRLDIRPGITCLWQVRGRSDLSFYKWVKWDLWYIDNWSFRLDFQILLWTIPAVLKRRGAY